MGIVKHQVLNRRIQSVLFSSDQNNRIDNNVVNEHG